MNTPHPAQPPSRRTRLLLALATAALAAACLAPTSALASVHPFLETFGAANQPSFVSPEGLAVDQSTGDLLVIDPGSQTISRWLPNGTPANFSALGANTIDGKLGPGGEPCALEPSSCDAESAIVPGGFSLGVASEVQVAVDNSGGETDGDIYVAQGTAHAIDIFSAEGKYLGRLSKFKEGLHAEGPGEPSLGETCGVAVDPEGSVYVGEYGEPEGHIHKYEPAGAIAVNTDNALNFPASRPCTLAAGAGPSAGSVFITSYDEAVTKFDGTTGAERYEVAPSPNTTVTVDPATGHLYVAAGRRNDLSKGSAVKEYDASGALEATLESTISPPSSVWGVAVDEESGDVYVAERANPKIEVWGPLVTNPDATTEAANPVGATSATLKGTVNPNGSALKSNPAEGCFFEYDTTKYNKEEAPHGEVAPCEAPDATEVGNGNAPVPVHAEVSGLKAGTTYHFRLLAENTNAGANGEDEALHTRGPAIKEEAALGVTDTAATLSGLIDPNGEATGFFFEYVSEADFLTSGYEEAISVPEPPGEELGAGSGFEEVSRQISGLIPDTAYRFRLIASNPSATVHGEDRSFATLPQAPPGLPDGRAYEMVTPASKLGEPFPPEPSESLGGTCKLPRPACVPGVQEITMAPMQSDPDGSAFVYEGQPFAENLASGANEYLSGRGTGGWGTEGLSSPPFDGIFKAFSTDLTRAVLGQLQPLTPEAPEREGLGFLNLYLWQEGALQPLLTEEPPQRDPGLSGANGFELSYEAANPGTATVPALSHVLFAANDALTEETPFAPAAPEVGAGGGGGGCNVGDDCNLYEWDEGQLRLVNVLPGEPPTASPGSVIGSRPSNNEPPDVDHSISDDGSRIFWSDESGQVYVRIDGEETVKVEDLGGFVTASADGSKVLLSDGCLYSLEEEECEDLTLDQGAVHQGGFQGILGAAEDLSNVYFVDTKILTGEEENANGEKAVEAAGKFNLYGWDEGATSFIGTLLVVDNEVVGLAGGRYGDWTPSSARRTAQVSADGRYLAFMSQAPLTGYTENKVSGGLCRPSITSTCFEVFTYDAATGSLACPSCNPSGQRPLGASNLSLFANVFAARAQAPLSPPHNLTTDGQGRLFFESQDTLSPHDTNGHIQDVYEWEPNGVGSCQRPAGCVFLISSGHDPGDSMFVNSTPSGSDAFFTTRERLLARDKDDLIDIYDARVNGGIAEEQAPICAGEACKGPLSAPPVQQGPGSSTFSGPGNQKPKHHRRHKHKKRHQRHKSHTRH